MKTRQFFPGLLFIALALVSFVANWSVLHTGFYTDDIGFLKGLTPFHAGSLFDYFNPARGWFYRPVFLTYFSVLLRIFGENAVAFHAVGLLLDVAVATTLAALMLRLSRNMALSALCGLAFVLYAEHSEAVAWISSASMLLAALFYLLCLHAWLTWRQGGSKWAYAAALATFWVSLCSKEDAISLPVALLLFDLFLCNARRASTRVKELAPFAVLCVAYIVADVYAMSRPDALGFDYAAQYKGSMGHTTWLQKLGFEVRFFAHMIQRILPLGATLLTTLFVALCSAYGLWLARRDAVLKTFSLWFVVAAVPIPIAAGLHLFTGNRFAYIPSLALVPLLVVATWKALKSQKDGVRVLGVAVLATLLRTTIHISDPTTEWSVLYLVLALAFVVWRMKFIDSRVLACVVVVALGSQMHLFFQGAPFEVWQLGAMTLIALLWRRDWWSGALVVALLWANPVVLLPTLIIGVALQKYKQNECATSSRAARSKMLLAR